jgi:hypothetical protein
MAEAADVPAVTQTPPVKLPEKGKFLLFLLAGQSNMAGRGVVEPEDQVPNPRVLTWTKDGKWVPTVDPIDFRSPSWSRRDCMMVAVGSRSGGLAAAISALSDGLYFCRFSVIIALFFLICVLQLPWINQNKDVYSPQSRW